MKGVILAFFLSLVSGIYADTKLAAGVISARRELTGDSPGTLGLVSAWSFDEASGDLLDLHGSNDGTAAGSPTYGEPGIVGDSILFDGSADNFNFGDVDAFDGATLTDGFTFAIFVKTSTASGDFIAQKNATWTVEMSGNKVISYVWLGGSWGNTGQVTTSIVDGAWHHVALRWDAADAGIDVFIDGVLEAGGTKAGVLGSNTNAVIFGTNAGGTADFPGNMDNAFFYSRPLTDLEIADLAAGRKYEDL